ncbi:MAG: hypothetical protein R3D67_12070 [Hyphomicrobiaceae bacterium]
MRLWVGQPAAVRIWGSHPAAEAEVRTALEAMAICRMVVFDGAPISYARTRSIIALIDGDHAAALPPGTWDCAVLADRLASASGQG